jgi:hypothetical protein
MLTLYGVRRLVESTRDGEVTAVETDTEVLGQD